MQFCGEQSQCLLVQSGMKLTALLSRISQKSHFQHTDLAHLTGLSPLNLL